MSTTADAATFYVDRNNLFANDSNPGTELQPWRTIQHAANTVTLGNTVIVKSGAYSERVTLNNSGSSSFPIVYKADPPRSAVTQGFEINGDYLRLEGFEVRNTGSAGILIRGDHIEVVNNGIFNLVNFGIAGNKIIPAPFGPTDVYIADNYIYGCETGLWASGTDWLVENNEVDRLVFVNVGGDANYCVVFGRNMTFRGNYFHGTDIDVDACPPGHGGPFDNAVCAHVDGWQTFNTNGETTENILIEGNIVTDTIDFVLMQDNQGTASVRNITVRNNVFIGQNHIGSLGRPAWGVSASIGQGLQNLVVDHNLFYNIALPFGFDDGTTATVRNNIIISCFTTYRIKNNPISNVTATNNMFFQTSGAITFPGDFMDIDPKVIDIGDLLGPDNTPFTLDDGYRLSDQSPAIDIGTPLGSILDLFGTERPQGLGYDLGPHELPGGSVDTDGDGVSDELEKIAGTDPNDENDTPEIPLAPLPLLVVMGIVGAIGTRIAWR